MVLRIVKECIDTEFLSGEGLKEKRKVSLAYWKKKISISF